MMPTITPQSKSQTGEIMSYILEFLEIQILFPDERSLKSEWDYFKTLLQKAHLDHERIKNYLYILRMLRKTQLSATGGPELSEAERIERLKKSRADILKYFSSTLTTSPISQRTRPAHPISQNKMLASIFDKELPLNKIVESVVFDTPNSDKLYRYLPPMNSSQDEKDEALIRADRREPIIKDISCSYFSGGTLSSLLNSRIQGRVDFNGIEGEVMTRKDSPENSLEECKSVTEFLANENEKLCRDYMGEEILLEGVSQIFAKAMDSTGVVERKSIEAKREEILEKSASGMSPEFHGIEAEIALLNHENLNENENNTFKGCLRNSIPEFQIKKHPKTLEEGASSDFLNKKSSFKKAGRLPENLRRG